MNDDLDIPDFLRVANRVPREPLKQERTKPGAKRPWSIPKGVEPAGVAMLKETEKQRA
jgi:hypothetical protein